MSQILSLPLTTVNKKFLTVNKRAISWFCGNVALTTQPRFYLFKVATGTLKALEQDMKYV